MVIDSISRNTITSAARQPVESSLTQELEQAERQEAQAQELSLRRAGEALPPIVNVLGQTTGTLINIVA